MIKATEYVKRRNDLMRKVGSKGIVILPAAPEILRNGDAVYAYRQNSDLYYLTGFEEPEAVLVLVPKRKNGEYILFNRVRDAAREIWDGPRAGQEGACRDFKANQAFAIDELEQILPDLLEDRETIHYPLGIHKEFDKKMMAALNTVRRRIRGGLQAPMSFKDVTESIHEMRLFKSPAELSVMQTAVDITAKAHIHAMQACQPGMHEYELEAELLYQFVKHGARTPAYNSIVGTGRNSCVLHYVDNNAQIKSGDIVLIDAGAEYQNYAADITRAFPANGKFTGEQRAIYDLVLASQLAAIKSIKPGAPWTAPQTAIIKTLTQGLIDLGLLKGKLDSLIEKKAYLAFYMHNSGHWLGLDVHDVGRYRVDNKWRSFQPGMVVTVEPGLYIADNIPGVHKRWHNIGVRIEDDIAVTKSGNTVLSHQIPKTVAEIEAVMA